MVATQLVVLKSKLLQYLCAALGGLLCAGADAATATAGAAAVGPWMLSLPRQLQQQLQLLVG